jgi:hypothetical protein
MGEGVLDELALRCQIVMVRLGVGVVLDGFGLFGEGGKLDLLHEVAYLLDLLIELRGLLLGLLLERSYLVVGLLDDVRHLLPLLVQLRFQFFVQVIKDNSFLSQRIDQQLQILIDRYALVELLVRLIQSILQDLYLLLQVGLALSSRVYP